jgi:hypothetical protein
MILDINSKKKIDICFQELTNHDVNKFKLTKRNGWFTWSNIFKHEENRVFGMFMLGNTNDILGIIAIQEDLVRQLIHVELMESAPNSQWDANPRKYQYIGSHLLGFAMNYSLMRFDDFEGFVGLFAKKNYNEQFYQKLNGKIANFLDGRPYYFFDTEVSRHYVQHFFPGGVQLCPN